MYANKINKENELLKIADGLDGMGKKPQAIAYYQKALDENKNSIPALSNLSILCYETNDLKSASKWSNRILKIDAENPTALVNLGNIAYLKKDFPKAIGYYEKAGSAKKDYLIAEINLANTYLEIKDYKNAVLHAKKTIKINHKNFLAHTILGNSFLELECFKDAIPAFKSALKLNPNDAWIYNSLSRAYQGVEDWNNALKCGWYAVITNRTQDDSQHINFGYLLYECFLEKGDSKVKKYADKWLDFFPDNEIVKHNVGAILHQPKNTKAPQEYVKNIFNVFSYDFDNVLKNLDYQAPDLINNFLKETYASKKQKLAILDVGCGTGLCGSLLAKYADAKKLDGVDISEKMLEVAKAKKIYSNLICDDLENYLKTSKKNYDLISAADVFTYFGDLKNVFAGACRVLKKNGRIIFTITENIESNDGFFLHASGRFLHTPEYIKTVLRDNGFSPDNIKKSKLRTEGGSAVMGYIVSAIKV